MRNGDFLPTRLQAQQDAVGMITQAKLRSNPESNVGLMSLADLDVLSTLTTGTGKVLAKLHAVQPKGQIKLIPGMCACEKIFLQNMQYFENSRQT